MFLVILNAMPHPHLISFVIPAWNEESVLGPTLEAVRVATRHLAAPSEVIVADDGSTDRTAEIARQHGAQVVTVHHRQISATRNAGAQAAQGDLLIFRMVHSTVSHYLCPSPIHSRPQRYGRVVWREAA